MDAFRNTRNPAARAAACNKYQLFTMRYSINANVARKLLIVSPSLAIVCCTMKRLMTKLEAFFLAMTLVEACEFKRGLRIRPKSANPATGKFPI